MDERARSLYPDLIEHGGLAGALRAAFTRIDSSMRVIELDGCISPVVCATVRWADREAQAFIAAKERLFMVEFWSRGVMLASGGTPDLESVAIAIDRWVGSNRTAGDMASAFDFVEARKDAWSYEQGMEVEERWRAYLKAVPRSIPGLGEVIASASERPALRQLFPFTSLDRLCFSRCTGYPFTRDTPSVAPSGDKRYRVEGSAGEDLGGGNVEEALDIVIEHLPPGCGPAVAGTADDIGRALRSGGSDAEEL